MKRSTEQKFRKFLKDHGIVLERYQGRHFRITKNGNYVASLSHTGKDSAIEECVKDLVRLDLLPTTAKRLHF